MLSGKGDKSKSNILRLPSIFAMVRLLGGVFHARPQDPHLAEVEELGSYTRAAQALSLTQPAVSHHIRMLEEEYGIQIFVKGSRELRPTADGALLLKYAHRAAAIAERARQALKDSLERIERLTIGITPTASDLLAPQVLAAYLRAQA